MRASTLVDVLRERAASRPERVAFTFIADNGADDRDVTFGQLDRHARDLAARLLGIGAAGERALLLFPPGLDYVVAFFGCLYAGVVAIPAYPPRPNRSFERLQSIAADARAALALTTSDILRQVEQHGLATPEMAGMRWLALDEFEGDCADEWIQPLIEGSTIAFLQYTSGSTAAPKGVILSHDKLLANLEAIRRAFGYDESSCGVNWLPPYHDMGLIGGVLEPCYLGVHMALLSPVTFLQRPITWLRAMSDYHATGAAAPDFAYDLCARKITPEQKASLDLNAWNVAVTGAEPVRADTIERFSRAFAPCGFRREAFTPSYGLAEATLLVTASELGRAPTFVCVRREALAKHRVVVDARGPDTTTIVGCGTPVDCEVRIVDPETRQPRAAGSIGEIWIAGPSVTRGYWDRPDDTAEAFGATTVDGDGPFLRTGDLGFLRDDELFVTGRIKDLIVIEGRNHYPQDIERTVERSHALVRPGGVAAFALDSGNRERLSLAVEVDRGIRPLLADPGIDEVTQAIRRAVAAEHDVRVHGIALLRPGGLPRTSSGKVRRFACRDGYLAGTLETWST